MQEGWYPAMRDCRPELCPVKFGGGIISTQQSSVLHASSSVWSEVPCSAKPPSSYSRSVICCAVWLSGIVVRESDMLFRGHGFDSHSFVCRLTTLCKSFTHTCLCY